MSAWFIKKASVYDSRKSTDWVCPYGAIHHHQPAKSLETKEE